jgi:hypothetical protein
MSRIIIPLCSPAQAQYLFCNHLSPSPGRSQSQRRLLGSQFAKPRWMANIEEADDLLDLLDEVYSAEPRSPRHAEIEEQLERIRCEQRWVSKSPDHGRKKRSRSASLTSIDAAREKMRAKIMEDVTEERDEVLKKIIQIDGISTAHIHGIRADVHDPEKEENLVLLQQHCDCKLELITAGGSEEFYVGICCSPKTRHEGNHDDSVPGRAYKGHHIAWEEMHLLCASTGFGASTLEKRILDKKKNKWRLFPTCQNKADGGQKPGPRNEVSFVYVVTGRKPGS